MTRLISIIILLSSITLHGSNVTLESLPCAQVGYIIIDLANGKTIASQNASTAFIPASTLKCITTATAISTLGSSYTFDTNIYHTGEIKADTLHGSLIIEGHGDPSIDISFCDQINGHNFSHITETVEVLSSQPYINPTAMIEDIGTDYGVGWSRFNYSSNRALINDSIQQLSLQHIIDDFIADLSITGIGIGNKLNGPSDTTLLFINKSHKLVDICRHMMYESDNLYAESIGRAISPTLDLTEALDSIVSFTSRLNIKPETLRIVDMSGLSRKNLITPSAMSRLLTAMSTNHDYISCFPVAGRDGTAKQFLNKSPLIGKIALKSGSMTGVLAYAGYKLDTTGKPTHVIVVMVNNAMCKQSVVKQCIEKWLLNNFKNEYTTAV